MAPSSFLTKVFSSLSGSSSSTYANCSKQRDLNRTHRQHQQTKSVSSKLPPTRQEPTKVKKIILRRVSLESLDKSCSDQKKNNKHDKSDENDCKYNKRTKDFHSYNKNKIQQQQVETRETPNKSKSSWSPASCALIIIFGLVFALDTLMISANANSPAAPQQNTSNDSINSNQSQNNNSTTTTTTTTSPKVSSIDCQTIQVLLEQKLAARNVSASADSLESVIAKYESDLSECRRASTPAPSINLTTASSIGVTLTSDLTTTTTTTSSEDSATTPLDGYENNNEDEEEEDNKLSSTVLATASEAADQLVTKLRSHSDNNNEEDDSTESTTVNNTDDNSTQLIPPNENNNIDVRSVNSQLDSTATTVTNNDNEFQPIVYKDPRENNKQFREAMKTYDKWVSSGSDIIELFARKLLPLIAEHGYEVDTKTMSGVLQIFNAIRSLKPWALKLLDASAKLTPGVLIGTQSDFGDYDECLNIVADEDATIRGQYCLADVEFPKPPKRTYLDEDTGRQVEEPIELRTPLLHFNTTRFRDTIFTETADFFHMLYVDPLRIGVCVTNQVEPESLETVINKVFAEFKVSIKFKGRCVMKNERVEWTSYQKISFYIIKTMIILVIISTCIDVVLANVKSKIMRDFCKLYGLVNYDKLMTSFSLIRNTKRLFKANKIRTLEASSEVVVTFETTGGNKTSSTTSLEGISSTSYSYLISSATSSSSTSSLTSKSVHQPTNNWSANTTPTAQHNNNQLGDNLQIGISVATAKQHSKNNPNEINIYDVNSSMLTKQQQQLNSATSSLAESGGLDKHEEQEAKKRITNDDMLCLHGIRVITMIWMIINHTYLFGGFFVLWAYRRLIDVAEWPKSLPFQLVLNGWLTVETYFFLSSMIIVLTLLPMMEKHKQKKQLQMDTSTAGNNKQRSKPQSTFNYFGFVLHRLVRLLPAYIGVVCLNFLWPLISSGPAWLVKGRSFIQEPCEDYLWANFLFINNWLWPEKMCMVHTWYLSADFQLYLVAPLIVYLLYKRPYIGHGVNLFVAILACIISGMVIYTNKLAPSTLINKLEFDSIKKQLHYSYFVTYQHMSPYCMGIFVGYLLYKKPDIKLPKRLTITLWIVLPPLSFTTLLLTYLWNGAYEDPNMINPTPLVSSIYVALHRFIWTSLLAWIVFACITGRAKFLNNLLSWPMFVPISRLSFSIYLVHLPVIMFRALNIRQTIEWTDTNMLWEASGNFTASVLIAYLINIMFESPFINLEKVLLGSCKKKRKKDSFDDLDYSEDQSSSNGGEALAISDIDNDCKSSNLRVTDTPPIQSSPIELIGKPSINTDSDSSINVNNYVNRTSRKRHTVIGTGKSGLDTVSLSVAGNNFNNGRQIRSMNIPRSSNYHTLNRLNSGPDSSVGSNAFGSCGRQSLTMNRSYYQSIDGNNLRLTPFYGTGKLMRAKLRQDQQNHQIGRAMQPQPQYSSDRFLRETNNYHNWTLSSNSPYRDNQMLSTNQQDLSYAGLMIPRVKTSTLIVDGARSEVNYTNGQQFSMLQNTKNVSDDERASVSSIDDGTTIQRSLHTMLPAYEISRSSILNSLSHQQTDQSQPMVIANTIAQQNEQVVNRVDKGPSSITQTIISTTKEDEQSSVDMVSTL